jgi:hypothetical protein
LKSAWVASGLSQIVGAQAPRSGGKLAATARMILCIQRFSHEEKWLRINQSTGIPFISRLLVKGSRVRPISSGLSIEEIAGLLRRGHREVRDKVAEVGRGA